MAGEEDEELSKWAAEVEGEYERPEETAEQATLGNDMELRVWQKDLSTSGIADDNSSL